MTLKSTTLSLPLPLIPFHKGKGREGKIRFLKCLTISIYRCILRDVIIKKFFVIRSSILNKSFLKERDLGS